MTTSGWVKSTTASAPDSLSSPIGSSLVDAGHQLEVGRRLDGPAHRRADLALRPEDAHLDRVAHGPQPIAGGAAEVSPLTPTAR